MDLHTSVIGAIATVNPQTPATISKSTGYTIAADYSQVPIYTTYTTKVQVQGLNEHEISHMASLNIEGVLRKCYFYGYVPGIVRADNRGGDVVNMLGKNWLVVHVLEVWPDWCACVVQQQVS